MPVATLNWKNDHLRIIDQTLLPAQLKHIECHDVATVSEAIKMLRVRGAPAIGVAAAYGVVIAAQEALISGAPAEHHIRVSIDILAGTRAPYAKIEDKRHLFLHGFHDRDQFLKARREI